MASHYEQVKAAFVNLIKKRLNVLTFNSVQSYLEYLNCFQINENASIISNKNYSEKQQLSKSL